MECGEGMGSASGASQWRVSRAVAIAAAAFSVAVCCCVTLAGTGLSLRTEAVSVAAGKGISAVEKSKVSKGAELVIKSAVRKAVAV